MKTPINSMEIEDARVQSVAIENRRKRGARAVRDSVRGGIYSRANLIHYVGHTEAEIKDAIEFGYVCELPDGSLAEDYRKLPAHCVAEACTLPIDECLSAHTWTLQPVEQVEEPRIKFRGWNKAHTYRTWTGTPELIQQAKVIANSKLLCARCRPLGGEKGRWVLFIEVAPAWLATEPPMPPPEDYMPIDHPIQDELNEIAEEKRVERVEQEREACKQRVAAVRSKAINRQKAATPAA